MSPTAQLLALSEARDVLDALEPSLCQRIVRACCEPDVTEDLATDLLAAVGLEASHLAWDGQLYVLLSMKERPDATSTRTVVH